MSETLLWLDLETTGLDPYRETILEVAAFTASLDKPFDLAPLYEAVIHCDPVVKAGVDPVVRGMHTENGLWVECEKSTVTLNQADFTLSRRLLGLSFADNEKAVLAGSSIHFDHSFIRKHMPFTAAHLSHRHYDVSAVKLFAQSLGMEKLPKGEAHRAAADVMESVAHAREVARWFSTRDRFNDSF